jgi:outer membrane protein, heavy metal efflux system
MCFAVASANAQAGLSLAEAIQEALARNPAAQASRYRIEASEALITQSGLRPNPRLILQTENTRFWDGPFSFPNETDNFAYLSQTFEAGGKRDRRRELAQNNALRSRTERDVVARTIASRVAFAYWNTASARDLLRLLRLDVERYDEIVTYHRNRFEQGAASEFDLMRVMLERDRLIATTRAAERDLQLARISLSRELGRDQDPNIDPSETLQSPAAVLPAVDLKLALERRPEWRLAAQNIATSEANARLQESIANPDPEVYFGYKRTSGLNTMMGGVQINLPFTNRNQGAIAAAQAETRAFQAAQLAVQRQIRTEIELAQTNVQARGSLLTEVLGPMRERAADLARIAQAAYREGGFDLLRVLDAERTRIETLIAYQRALGEYQQSVTELRIAMGELP